MKNLLIAIFLLFITATGHAQDSNEMYLLAYKHIAKDVKLTNDIIVSDSLQPIKLMFFVSELSKEWKVAQEEAYSRLLTKMGKASTVIHNPYVGSLNTPAKQPRRIIFFSSISDNLLTAEIFDLQSYRKTQGYNDVVGFNSSNNYLFIFKKSKITKVYKNFIPYD